MANILIVEDDLNIGRGLEKMLRQIEGDIDQGITLNIHLTGYAEEALCLAKTRTVDVFLLDIQLLDYSGIELAKQLRALPQYTLTPIIFITAVPSRELMAFKTLHCYDYILKPFEPQEVYATLETIVRYGVIKPKVDALRALPKNSENLTIEERSYTYVVQSSSILFLESRGRTLHIFTDKECITTNQLRLKDALDMLGDEFIQCHKSYVVRKSLIMARDHAKNTLQLSGHHGSIPIGRLFKSAIQEII